jgi:hypothetical protein
MGKEKTILALENAARYIAQDQLGTVHVVWDHLTIRLRPADFLQVVGRVEDAYTGMLDQSESDCLRVTIQGIGLSFSPADLVVLRELICLAAIGIGPVEETDGTIYHKHQVPRGGCPK